MPGSKTSKSKPLAKGPRAASNRARVSDGDAAKETTLERKPEGRPTTGVADRKVFRELREAARAVAQLRQERPGQQYRVVRTMDPSGEAVYEIVPVH